MKSKKDATHVGMESPFQRGYQGSKFQLNKAPQVSEELSLQDQEIMAMMMPDFDQQIDICVEEIWGQSDMDNNGFLDKIEMEKLFKRTLVELGETYDFTDGDFKTAFKEFDKNRDGRIQKEEMKIFILKMAGL